MRLEYKYIVPVHLLDEVRRDILPWVTPDAFAARSAQHQYTVRSIYLDTPRLDAYREKLEGYKERKKIRIRSYNLQHDDCIAYLEIKRKSDQRGMKHRAMVRFSQLPLLMETKDVEEFVLPGQDCDTSYGNARRFLFHIVRSSMNPVVLVTYEREAYEGVLDPSLRVTFDKYLRYKPFPGWSELYHDGALRHVAPRYFILEVKFNNGFSPWLQSVIIRHNLVRTSVSKYGSSIAVCPELKPMLPKRLHKRTPIGTRTQLEVVV